MNRLVARAFDVAVHDRRGGANAQFMGGLDQVDPLGSADSSRRHLTTNLVDQDFRGGSRQAADAGVLEGLQIFPNTRARESRTVENFLGRKSVNMNVG